MGNRERWGAVGSQARWGRGRFCFFFLFSPPLDLPLNPGSQKRRVAQTWGTLENGTVAFFAVSLPPESHLLQRELRPLCGIVSHGKQPI